MGINEKDDDVNSIQSDDDFGLADIARLEEQFAKKPASFRQLNLRAREARKAIEAINNLEASSPGSTSNEFFQKRLINAKRTRTNLLPKIALYSETARERTNTQISNVVNREFSERAIGSYVSGNMNSLEAQIAGASMSAQGYGSLAQQRTNIMSQIGGLQKESLAAASSYMVKGGVNAESAATIQGNAGQVKELAQQLIPITIAMQQLKQQGLDPQSKQRDLIKVTDRAASLIHSNELESEMRSGKGLGALSNAELRKKEHEAAEKLVKTFGELTNSAGKSAEELATLNKNAEEAAEEFKQISEAKALGGKDGGDGLRTASIALSAVGQMVGQISNIIQTMAIDQPMRQMGNIAGYANIENQKYDTWTRAVEGNMTERLNMSGFENASAFGASMANRKGWVMGARIGGSVLGTAAGIVQAVDVGKSAVGGTIGSGLGLKSADTVQGFANAGTAILENGGNAAIGIKDVIQHISTSETELAAHQTAMAVTKQMNHILGYQLQQYRDHIMGAQGAAINMGGSANAFLGQAASSGFMDRMSGVGLDIKEFGQLSQFGSENMGSTFNANTAIRAKHYENLGYGSAAENMQRMAGLAAAGSQNPMQSMEKILERAVGAGFDSSKAIGIIADNTGQMVEQGIAKGEQADLADTISRLIVGGADKTNPNKEFAIKQAAETYKTEEQWRTNTSTSFAGMINVARTQKDLQLDFPSALIAAETSTAQWQKWSEMAKSGKADQLTQVKEQMFGKGIDVRNNALFDSDPNKFFTIGTEGRVLGEIERGGAGWAFQGTEDWKRLEEVAKKDKGLRSVLRTGKGILSQEKWIQDAVGKINKSISSQKGNPQAVFRDIFSILGLSDGETAEIGAEGTYQEGAFGTNQRERTRGAKKRIQAAQAGVGQFAGKDFSGEAGIGFIAETGKNAHEAPGSNAEGNFSNSAARAAHDLTTSATKLGFAGDKLIEAAKALLESAGANRTDKKKSNAEEAEIRQTMGQVTGKLDKVKKYLPDVNPQESQGWNWDGTKK